MPTPQPSTTINSDSLEPWQILGYRSYEDYLADTNADSSTGAIPPPPANLNSPEGQQWIATYGSLFPSATETSTYGDFSPSNSTTSGTTTSTSSTTPDIRYVNGQSFDMADPQQYLAYFAAQRDAYISEAQKATEDNLTQAGETYGQNKQSLTRDIGALDRARSSYGQSVVKNIKNLGEGYDLGTVNRANYFAGLSPNAYQSAQGSGQQYARGKLDEGIGEYQQAAAEAKSNFDQQGQDLGQEQTGLESEYNRYVQGQQDYLTKAQQQASDFYNTQGATAYAPGNTSAFSHAHGAFTPYQAPTVDVSKYTPFTNFSTLPTTPATGNVFQAPTTPQAPDQNTLESYLGYTPTQQEKDLLSKYLKQGV